MAIQKIFFRTWSADAHKLIMRVLHDGKAIVPSSARIGDIQNILGKINVQSKNVDLVYEDGQLVLKKVSGAFVMPALGKKKKV